MVRDSVGQLRPRTAEFPDPWLKSPCDRPELASSNRLKSRILWILGFAPVFSPYERRAHARVGAGPASPTSPTKTSTRLRPHRRGPRTAATPGGGNFSDGMFQNWMKDDKSMVTCCTDGIRPVIFQVERLD